jgi:hypothetical protein
MPPNDAATLMFVPRLRALVEEGRRMSAADFVRRVVTLRVALTTTTTTDSRTYQVPTTHKALIMGVRGHLGAMVSTDSVTPAGSGGAAVTVSTAQVEGLSRWKAQNCRIQLTDENSENIIGEGQPALLSTFLAETGGRPFDWEGAPRIVAPGVTLTMTATLISTVAAQVGSSTEYGVNLDVVLVRVKES